MPFLRLSQHLAVNNICRSAAAAASSSNKRANPDWEEGAGHTDPENIVGMDVETGFLPDNDDNNDVPSEGGNETLATRRSVRISHRNHRRRMDLALQGRSVDTSTRHFVEEDLTMSWSDEQDDWVHDPLVGHTPSEDSSEDADDHQEGVRFSFEIDPQHPLASTTALDHVSIDSVGVFARRTRAQCYPPPPPDRRALPDGLGVTEIHKVEDALAEMASLTIKEEGLLELYQLLIVEARTSRTTFDKMVGYLTRHVGTTFLKTDTIPRLNAFCTAMSQKFKVPEPEPVPVPLETDTDGTDDYRRSYGIMGSHVKWDKQKDSWDRSWENGLHSL
jgi:hypothetical protein